MTITTPKATCLLCNEKFSKSGMSRHIPNCIQKNLPASPEKEEPKTSFFHLLVLGYHSPEYWLHLKADTYTTLEDLDRFLRNIWVECCGHLSAFYLNRNELKMTRKIKDIMSPGMELLYEYDFGSTTELLIKVIDKYQGPVNKNEPIEILARNEAPEIMCNECGKALAVQICTECMYDGRGWLCQSCADNHECGEDMMLPVVNSPRTGVCGYSG